MSKKRRFEQVRQSIVHNRKARYRYEILDRLECGICLQGPEIKSLRNHEVSLDEAYAVITETGELWLQGCHINPYKEAGPLNPPPTRKRKLLAHKREIRKWRPQLQARGLTLVPLEMHFNDRGYAKVTIALVRGKKVADKRRDLKKKAHQREMDRAQRR